jgi:hypothetical protein
MNILLTKETIYEVTIVIMTASLVLFIALMIVSAIRITISYSLEKLFGKFFEPLNQVDSLEHLKSIISILNN